MLIRVNEFTQTAKLQTLFFPMDIEFSKWLRYELVYVTRNFHHIYSDISRIDDISAVMTTKPMSSISPISYLKEMITINIHYNETTW